MPIVLVTHDFDDVVRLASHVVLLERGVSVAAGPITGLMSRPDLPWLREAVGLGSVFDATVTRTLGHRGLVELSFDGGGLLATDRTLGTGTVVRVRDPGARGDPGDVSARGPEPSQRTERKRCLRSMLPIASST